MKLTRDEWLRDIGKRIKRGAVVVVLMVLELLARMASGQAITTTTVQGTVYLANGQPGSGTLRVSWPSFTTANGQAIAADSMTLKIGTDGFVSVNLAPNLGATPAGLYYTAVLYLSDGTASTQYWVVPAAAQASLAAVQSQVMPAAQAVQAVNKAYVDQAIQALGQGVFTLSGGTMTGPLYLNGDPTQALQAADKHYVDTGLSQALPLAGGAATGALTAKQLGAAYQVDQFAGADFGAKLQACLNGVSATYGGTCDARNFTGNLAMASNVTISTGNTTVQLPCATITTANQLIVTAGTRNVAVRGCALRGGTQASGSQGGTVFSYSGAKAMVQVGDPTYGVDTQGFHMDDVVINTTAATSAAAQGLVAYRTQEMDLQSLYFLGNANQTGMTLDGTGNYTGGTFYDNAFGGFQTAVNAIGHQVSNGAITDWMNASAFVRLHINCPTSGGNPIAGTYGINLQQGDGNTFTGGDVEGCATALHLGAGAQGNTIVGLRNENSTNQVVADAGSAYNSWITGGTMFTGKLTDNGTRNSFLDTFHRSFNGMNGDWYGSQQDATVTNHFRLGTALGNERGLLNRYQTDYGYRWTMGLSDAAAGEQFYQVLDELNNVYRLSIGQYNHGQASTNNQTVINAAGTGAVVLNGSTNAGTGGLVVGSGGANAVAVATINNAGNAQFNGTLQVTGASTFTSTTTVKNQADAEVDQVLWAGATTGQKEALTYKDWNGASQWYAMKDASNNWALYSATGGLDSFKAYQSTNSGDTYVNASNATGVVRVNYENGAGTGFKVYGGNSGSLYASFTGTNSIQFPGLAAASGRNCLQIDNSGYVTNTGSACGSGSGSSGSGTVNSANAGQIAYYTTNGSVLGGMNTVPVSAGGTGSATAAGAMANLGGVSVVNVLSYGAVGTGTLGSAGAGDTANTSAIQNAINAAVALKGELYFPCGVYNVNQPLTVYSYQSIPIVGQGWGCTILQYTGTAPVTQGMLTVTGVAPATNCTSVSCNHTTGMPLFGATGFQLENISLVGNANVPDGLDLIAVASFHLKDVAVLGAGNAAIYCQTCQQGQMDVPIVSYNALWGVANYVANQTPNGIILDGYSSPNLDNTANHVSINSMNANLMTGKALWLRDSTQNTITNCQLSSNAINIQIDNAGGDLFDNCMSEPAASGYGAGWLNIGSNAFNETFVSSAVYGPANIAGSLNRFIGGSIGTTTIAATAHNNLFDGVGVANNASNLTDNSPDTEYRPMYDTVSAMAPANFPSWRRTPPSQMGGCSGVLSLTGAWNTSGAAVNLDPAPLCGLTSGWRAAFSGIWTGPGGYENVATVYEFSNGSPTLTLPSGGTATVSVSSGRLQLSTAGVGGAIAFTGSIDFTPYAFGDSADFASGISASAYRVGGNVVIPTTTVGSHGSSGAYVQMSDGSASSGNLAKFAADGSVTNGPTAPAGAIVGTTDTQTLTNKTLDGVSPATMGYLDATSSVQAQLNGKAPTLTAHTMSVPAICTTSGSANSYTCTTNPSFTPAVGDRIQINFNAANTGGATLAVNGGSAYAVYKNGGTATLASGDVQANHWVSAVFDSNNRWQLEGQLGQVNATQMNGAAVPASKARLASDASGHVVAAANTLGCADGYDHLPCVVFAQSIVSESTQTGSYATVWTAASTGTYRITGYIYGTTASSTAYTVSHYVKATQTGQSSGNGYLVASAQVGSSISSGSAYAYVFPLNAGTAVQTESLTASGSNTGGVWSRAIVVERLQ